MNADRKKATSSYVLLKRLFRDYLRGHVRSFVIATIHMAIAAATTGALAKMIEPIVNQLGKGRSDFYILSLGAMVIVIFAARGISTYYHTVIMNRVGQRIVTDVQQHLHAHLLRSDLSFFHANSSGELISRLTNDVGIMRQAVGECMTSTFKGSLTLAFLVGVMFYQDWRMSITAFFVFPLSAYFVAMLGKHMRRYSRKSQEETGRFASLLSQIFLGMRHVKAYGMEGSEHGRVKDVTEAVYKLAVKGYHVSALANPMAEFLSGIAILSVIVYGNWRVEAGLTTTGALLSFITAFVLAFDPMKRTAKVNAQLQAGLAAAERIFDILDIQPQIVDQPQAVPLHAQKFDIAIENVLFRYPDGTTALDHVTIAVPHGQTVAIVGPSGAGKSTIINLIPRFYDIEQGHISIGGQDIRSVTMSSLRQNLALVSQETALFDESIRTNIAYGRPDASFEDIVKAAEDAFADGFIRELPYGYDTVVGESGVKLSGGQRQRIAIARAMLRNAPILLLDEATSALDNESERAVQAALARLQKGRTTIVVAHRLSTIVDADLIVVMDKGQVVEQGTHTELLAKKGVYARLYGMQGGLEFVNS
ncbi:MAG: ABC transporter ATP-binding protein [Proteobacteria bacterium]|jgi:subfamily B ATP-binding cassette protein MsbA|nr:ABC transporter ATP-binding protein [Alphaproteobacteria bacterium]NCC02511.1 ABC transporter ATP-binding protein [Pseudomonadota bacterium]